MCQTIRIKNKEITNPKFRIESLLEENRDMTEEKHLHKKIK